MKTATIAFRLSEKEKEQLENIATTKDIPVSQLVREAIRKYLLKKEND